MSSLQLPGYLRCFLLLLTSCDVPCQKPLYIITLWWCSSEIRKKSPDTVYLNHLIEKSKTDLLYQKCSMIKKQIKKKMANFDYFLDAWKELNSSEQQSKMNKKIFKKWGCYFRIANKARSKWIWVLKQSHLQKLVTSKHRLRSSFLKRHFKIHSEAVIQRFICLLKW